MSEAEGLSPSLSNQDGISSIPTAFLRFNDFRCFKISSEVIGLSRNFGTVSF